MCVRVCAYTCVCVCVYACRCLLQQAFHMRQGLGQRRRAGGANVLLHLVVEEAAQLGLRAFVFGLGKGLHFLLQPLHHRHGHVRFGRRVSADVEGYCLGDNSQAAVRPLPHRHIGGQANGGHGEAGEGLDVGSAHAQSGLDARILDVGEGAQAAAGAGEVFDAWRYPLPRHRHQAAERSVVGRARAQGLHGVLQLCVSLAFEELLQFFEKARETVPADLRHRGEAHLVIFEMGNTGVACEELVAGEQLEDRHEEAALLHVLVRQEAQQQAAQVEGGVPAHDPEVERVGQQLVEEEEAQRVVAPLEVEALGHVLVERSHHLQPCRLHRSGVGGRDEGRREGVGGHPGLVHDRA